MNFPPSHVLKRFPTAITKADGLAVHVESFARSSHQKSLLVLLYQYIDSIFQKQSRMDPTLGGK